MKRIGPVAFLALALVACGVGPVPDDADGATIYQVICANCHGVDLEGRIGPALGPGSNSAAQPDSFIETTVRHGRGSMPSFRSTLSDEQIGRVIEYIREAQQR